MSAYSLSKSRFCEGVWEGVLSASTDDAPLPEIEARVHDRALAGVTVEPLGDPATWRVSVPVPADMIGDGVHTVVLSETALGQRLGDFTIIAGDAAGEDIRAELTLLRAELDLLKRSFRRHCRETA
ncbi:hypothetical protein [Marivita sp. GX14005]|uniref:hypothetical protein n=1 Tax=Marivita sp. GX14005 TaxID=2942276 RepID=UPI002018C103|nr:hypothetical protein [Marivita sp. GX14005]MCL3881335.1 hypothetical protein [Marivita sp. GX14005]